jgi:hypothetical protein
MWAMNRTKKPVLVSHDPWRGGALLLSRSTEKGAPCLAFLRDVGFHGPIPLAILLIHPTRFPYP